MSRFDYFFRGIVRRCEPLQSPSLYCQLACGSSLFLGTLSWIALFGLGLSVCFATVFAIGLSMTMALGISRKWSRPWPTWSLWMAMGVWLSLMPIWVSLGGSVVRCFTPTMLESITVQTIAMLPGALVIMGLPVFLLTLLISRSEQQTKLSVSWQLFAGVVLTSLVWETWIPAEYFTWGIVAVILSGTLWSFFQQSHASAITQEITGFVNYKEPKLGIRLSWCLPACLAGLWVGMSAVIRPWVLLNTTMLIGPFLILAGTFLTTITLLQSHRCRRWLTRIPAICWMTIPCITVLTMIVLEENFVYVLMRISSEWPTPVWQQAARLAILSPVAVTTGLAIGYWWNCQPTMSSSTRHWNTTGPIIFAAAAFCVSRGVISGVITPVTLIWGLSIAGCTAGFLDTVRHNSIPRRTQIFAGVVTSVMILTGLLLPQQTGVLASKLTFNPQAWTQLQRGLPWDDLSYADDSRLIDSVQTSEGQTAAYNVLGLQTSLRRNGIADGYLSHDYRVMPQFPTDAILAVLPTVLHGNVSQMAISRWGCGVTASSALEFPIQILDCYHTDPEVAQLTFGRQLDNPWAGINPLQDNRVNLSSTRPEFAFRASGQKYDVIISNPFRSATVEGASEMTVDYYRSASERLAPQGLFCQRFQHYDHGPEAWAEVMQSLRTVFPSVLAIEMLPGETLFVAGENKSLLINEELADRLQKPQIRRVLSRFGWDWGHVLQLPTVTAGKTDELLAQLAPASQSTVTPKLLVAHGRDALRWSNKWEEKTNALSPYRSRLVSLAGEKGEVSDIKRRMEEVSAQQHHMAEIVDAPWSYRSKLKEFLSLKPRSEIRQVKGEKPKQEMHPIDQRRVEYLEALSDAHQTRPASTEMISRLNEFTTPYDPLISYFLHHEAAELYARNPGLDPHAEYFHRLKTIYFGDVRDKSVRNVIGALDLLLEYEELIPDDQTRFDQLHGLAQFLMNRWQLRVGYSPRNSDEGLSDVRESLRVAELTLDELDQLAEETAYGSENWKHRRDYLELHLIKPLRSYRGKLIPHHQNRVLKQAKNESQ